MSTVLVAPVGTPPPVPVVRRGVDVERMGFAVSVLRVTEGRTGTTPGGMPWRGSPPYRVRGRMRP